MSTVIFLISYETEEKLKCNIFFRQVVSRLSFRLSPTQKPLMCGLALVRYSWQFSITLIILLFDNNQHQSLKSHKNPNFAHKGPNTNIAKYTDNLKRGQAM